MSFVVTLISSPANPAVDDALIEKLAALVPGETRHEWLNPGIAADIFTTQALSVSEATDTLRSALGETPVDLFVQPATNRRKRLLIADMDSTMIGQECIDELAAELGLKDTIAAITERAMRGEIEFEPALQERVALLKGLDSSVVEKVIAERITLTPGGRTLVQTMKANLGYAALVSGGFTVFTSKIAEKIGFDENRANTLLEEAGKLTGTVQMPILGKQAKLDRLNELLSEKKIEPDDVIAVGDGANDLAMLERAGIGAAFYAKPAVAAQADMRIDHSDLTALLYIQGYNAEEFVTD
ncbi:phosphoserine phosphatase SerB [Pseudovibrio exalbescens]|uniref:phosphoserine phosphatase SerB n=1 Tax=Pseudovibrio exalbescens TaxID=197461 RepID=UPI0023667453|nr:phosphoserine phosphatase SerB [Pseudovibrio exalbescens]MDD7910354.1 phosphoserine phosphatase SerB [Pseudovibrio exalbescens]